MAWPLVAMAGIGAAKSIAGARSAGKQAENEWRKAEDQRKRAQKVFELSGIRNEHGAEQRKTLGGILGGFLENFGRDPTSGAFRNPNFKAMRDDVWQYRDKDELSKLSPHLDPLPKPKGPGFGGYLGAGLGGALEGAGSYVAAGGTLPGMGGAPSGGGAGAANPFGPTSIPTTVQGSPYSPDEWGPATGFRMPSPTIY